MLLSESSVQLSLCHQSFIDLAPVAFLDVAKEAGFQSIGLRTHASTAGGLVYHIPSGTDAMREMRYRLNDFGMSVLCVESVTLDDETEIAGLAAFLEGGAELGATRIVVNGGGADFGIVADKLQVLCEKAAPFGLIVELEFMPFRKVKSLQDAQMVVRRVHAENCQIMIDALHFARSNSAISDLAHMQSARIGTFHLCDAPLIPPADLPMEARQDRLLPGEGALPLHEMLDALPAGVPIGVEVPLGECYRSLPALDRARLIARASRSIFQARENSERRDSRNG